MEWKRHFHSIEKGQYFNEIAWYNPTEINQQWKLAVQRDLRLLERVIDYIGKRWKDIANCVGEKTLKGRSLPHMHTMIHHEWFKRPVLSEIISIFFGAFKRALLQKHEISTLPAYSHCVALLDSYILSMSSAADISAACVLDGK